MPLPKHQLNSDSYRPNRTVAKESSLPRRITSVAQHPLFLSFHRIAYVLSRWCEPRRIPIDSDEWRPGQLRGWYHSWGQVKPTISGLGPNIGMLQLSIEIERRRVTVILHSHRGFSRYWIGPVLGAQGNIVRHTRNDTPEFPPGGVGTDCAAQVGVLR